MTFCSSMHCYSCDSLVIVCRGSLNVSVRYGKGISMSASSRAFLTVAIISAVASRKGIGWEFVQANILKSILLAPKPTGKILVPLS